jgi:glycosyltransferase involved in cell wall biosynthesis
MLTLSFPTFGIVAIGRNEGERLKQCLRSATEAAVTIYVDSGSSDGSDKWARSQGVDVVELDKGVPFTAARARNQGFKRLRELAPDIRYVQFIDGDCELQRDWPNHALRFLEDHREYCAVFGRRRERHPDISIYNRLCDNEWNGPVGEARACGGDVIVDPVGADMLLRRERPCMAAHQNIIGSGNPVGHGYGRYACLSLFVLAHSCLVSGPGCLF